MTHFFTIYATLEQQILDLAITFFRNFIFETEGSDSVLGVIMSRLLAKVIYNYTVNFDK